MELRKILGGTDLATEVARLREEVAQLRRLVLAGRQIDLVDWGELRVLFYTDDLAYIQIADKYKRHTPSKDKRDLSTPRREPDERYNNPREPLIGLLLSHYWTHNLPFTFIDVGCQYGTSAMATAQVILATGRNEHVYAFDCGVAAGLAPFNIILNGFEERVTFERYAVSNGSYPTLVFTELGHSENNRVVDRLPAVESLSYPVMAVSIDEYLDRKGVSEHVIAKIDTQGGEVEVLEGMRRTLANRLVTAIVEFTPHALMKRVNPGEWLDSLLKTHAIFDCGNQDYYLGPRKPMTSASNGVRFAEEVARRTIPYTDILMVPRNISHFDSFVQRLQ